MEALQLLSRNEMKMIRGGKKVNNIFCRLGETQYQCGSGQWDLIQCLDGCMNSAEYWGETCEGCAQFPELY